MRNIDYAYVSKMEAQNDEIWRKRERNLYYHWKNKEYILPTIIGSLPFLIMKGGWMVIALILFFDFLFCDLNNKELDKSVHIQKKREEIRRTRREFYGQNV